MKTLILSTVTAAALALSVGTAFASQDTDRSTQYDFLQQSASVSPAHVRHFTIAPAIQSAQSVSPTASDNARDQAEREAVLLNNR